jgi:imidazoleglycerol-phosphate dehydratase
MKKPRAATIKRETKETKVNLELKLDGSGQQQIKTGIKMLDHLLSQMAQHGRFDLIIKASGDDQHHVAEDIAICLGKALGEALGEKRSIIRMGDAAVPMDDAMAAVAVDISGRGYTVLDLTFVDNDMLGFATDLIRHFLESLAIEARLNLHARILYGTNDHHKAEALFKALGRALDIATRVDERLAGKLPTTKGMLEE